MKDSKKFMFRADTMDGRSFHISAVCLHEALDKAEDYLDERHGEDILTAVKMCRSEYIVDDDEETDLDRPKLSVVAPESTPS